MKKSLAVTALAASSLLTIAVAHENHDHSAEPVALAVVPETRVGDPWPLDTCVVSGMKLGSMGEPIIRLHDGREVRLCCAGCTGAFERDSEQFLAKADEAIKEQQKAFYPLTHCIIDTDEAISEDESENAYSVVGNRLFVYCCPPCDKPVRAEPAKYIEILDKAVIARQSETYPLETCVVSGQALDSMGGAIDMVIANQLVRLCCAGCKGAVEANPAEVLGKLAEARKAATEDAVE